MNLYSVATCKSASDNSEISREASRLTYRYPWGWRGVLLHELVEQAPIRRFRSWAAAARHMGVNPTPRPTFDDILRVTVP